MPEGHAGRSPKTDDSRHILRAGPQPVLLAATEQGRLQRNAGAPVQTSYTLRTMQFMGGNGRIIHIHPMQAHGNLSGTLHRIQMHGQTMPPGAGAQSRRILKHARLVISPGKGNAARLPSTQGFPFFRYGPSFTVHGTHAPVPQGNGCFQGSIVIRGQYGHALSFTGHLPEGGIRGLRSSGSKHDFLRRRSQQGRHSGAGFLHRLPYAPGFCIPRGRVEKPFFQERFHGGVNFRKKGGGGVIVPINHAFITRPIPDRSQAGT